MGIDNVLNKLAKIAVLGAGITAAVYLTPLVVPAYASSYTPLAVSASLGAGAGYIVGSAAYSKPSK